MKKSAKSLPSSATSASNEDKVEELFESLNIGRILQQYDKAWGNEMYTGRRSMGVVEKASPHSAEVVMMKAHLERAAAATQLTPKSLPTLSKEERKRLVALVTSEGAESLEWPVATQCVGEFAAERGDEGSQQTNIISIIIVMGR